MTWRTEKGRKAREIMGPLTWTDEFGSAIWTHSLEEAGDLWRIFLTCDEDTEQHLASDHEAGCLLAEQARTWLDDHHCEVVRGNISPAWDSDMTWIWRSLPPGTECGAWDDYHAALIDAVIAAHEEQDGNPATH